MVNINIVSISPQLKPHILEISQHIRPQCTHLDSRVDWFTFKNPFREAESIPGLLAMTDKPDCAGLFMLNRMEYFDNQEKRIGFFGYDYFVKEEFRGQGAGAFLIIRSVRGYKPFFGMGLTLIAEKLYERVGVPTIGSIRKFLWIHKPMSAIVHFLKYKISKKKFSEDKLKDFPLSVVVQNCEFKLVDESGLKSYSERYDQGVLQFSRSIAFLKWRFFNAPNKYYFYQCVNSPQNYFVLRPVKSRGMNLLLVVDYKLPLGDQKAGEVCFRAMQSIAKTLGVDGLAASSTHKFFDQVLKSRNFLAVGRPSPVVSTINGFEKDKTKYVNRDIYFTMADSDLDLNFGDI